MATSANRRDHSPAGSDSPPLSVPSTSPEGDENAVADVVIDCDTCAARGRGCPDCVVTFLLGGPPDDIVVDGEEQRALQVLASAGLIPPLRMVRPL
jgi:hypothetical protein